MTPKSRKSLKLHKDTVRVLQDQAAVRFGPQTSETEPCCTWAPDTQPVRTIAGDA
jgi:hypothetical protein